jgi:hypothetical protein
MTRLLRLLCAPLLFVPFLAACGGGSRPGASPPPQERESPEAAQCREEARRSPEVTRLARELNPSNLANAQRVGEERRIAEVRAFRDCMVRRGAALPGGVEPRRRF